MYNKIENMLIDDKWQIIKISDHNLIQITLNMKIKHDKEQIKRQEFTTYRINDKRLAKLTNKLKEHLPARENIMSVQSFEEILKTCCEQELKVRVIERKKPENKNPKWFNDDIKKEISTKREISKALRKEDTQERRTILAERLKVKKE